MNTVSRTCIGLVLGAAAVMAQSVIAARSGLVHQTLGAVYINGQRVESKPGVFPDVKENGVLKTTEGRAEVLLTPGVFLRLGENSSFRMLTNRLSDTRLEVLTGSAILEADDILKDNAVTVVYKDFAVHLNSRGLYRFDADPASLRVFDGQATVSGGGQDLVVKEGKRLTFDSQLAVASFNEDATDALDRWSRRQGEYIAMANVSAANSLSLSRTGSHESLWMWNAYFGMFTFMPGSGMFSSPYGYRFYSPGTVYQAYQPAITWNSGRGMSSGNGFGYSTMPQTSSGYSGVTAAASSVSSGAHAPSSSASAAASAPVSSTGGGASAGGARK